MTNLDVMQKNLTPFKIAEICSQHHEAYNKLMKGFNWEAKAVRYCVDHAEELLRYWHTEYFTSGAIDSLDAFEAIEALELLDLARESLQQALEAVVDAFGDCTCSDTLAAAETVAELRKVTEPWFKVGA